MSQTTPRIQPSISAIFRSFSSKSRSNKPSKRSIHIRTTQPRRNGVRVLLVCIATLLRERFTPQSRIHLRHRRSPRRNLPAIKRPKMHVRVRPDITQPWQSAMRRLRNRALHVKMKYRLSPGTYLCNASPRRSPRPRRSIAVHTVTDKIYIDVLIIGRPMQLEVVQESTPIEGQVVLLKIPKRKGEAVVNTNQRRLASRKAVPPIAPRFRGESNIFLAPPVAESRPASRLDPQRTSANRGGLTTASERRSSQSRYSGQTQCTSRSRQQLIHSPIGLSDRSAMIHNPRKI